MLPTGVVFLSRPFSAVSCLQLAGSGVDERVYVAVSDKSYVAVVSTATGRRGAPRQPVALCYDLARVYIVARARPEGTLLCSLRFPPPPPPCSVLGKIAVKDPIAVVTAKNGDILIGSNKKSTVLVRSGDSLSERTAALLTTASRNAQTVMGCRSDACASTPGLGLLCGRSVGGGQRLVHPQPQGRLSRTTLRTASADMLQA